MTNGGLSCSKSQNERLARFLVMMDEMREFVAAITLWVLCPKIKYYVIV